jgi:hypothetical protein
MSGFNIWFRVQFYYLMLLLLLLFKLKKHMNA